MPSWLRSPDPDWREERELRRDQYALVVQGRMDRPIELTGRYGTVPFDVETALEWAERLAEDQLP